MIDSLDMAPEPIGGSLKSFGILSFFRMLQLEKWLTV
jgi:hypothetical protein